MMKYNIVAVNGRYTECLGFSRAGYCWFGAVNGLKKAIERIETLSGIELDKFKTGRVDMRRYPSHIAEVFNGEGRRMPYTRFYLVCEKDA